MSSPLSNELLEFCRSDSLSEEGLRQIIDRHALAVTHLGSYKLFRAACRNGLLTEGIIRCLLEYSPAAARSTGSNGQQPLHCVCRNPNVTPRISPLLIDAAPDSVRSEDNYGNMPLHNLCKTKALDGAAAIEILELLIERYPEVHEGLFPIHIASGNKSPEFCNVLIEAYPGCKRILDSDGMLPLHSACLCNAVATVEYLHKLYPDAINHTTTTSGSHPVHFAITGLLHRDNPITAVDIVKYLLQCDPTVKFQKIRGTDSLLHFTLNVLVYNDSTVDVGIQIDIGIQIIKVIYDAHPEAIELNTIASVIQSWHERVQAFINSQLFYARQAKNHRLMTTPDSNGQLPLHRALQNNVRLGSTKLLVKGNTPAVQSPDNRGALPLHIACQHHESASVVQYLVGLDATTLDAVDRDGNTALHLACHFARHEIVALLLDKFDAVSVSKRNSRKKLPIDLLWESNEVEDKESVEYTESVFRLLTAYPETVMNICIQNQSASANCPRSSGKKRKFGNE
eukprot:scaffold3316_cov94-Skeletonema_marinoi.AAC.19